MARIVRISYAAGGTFDVRVDDPDAGIIDLVAAGPINQLAVDAAFERRVPVDLELEGNKIVRVASLEPATDPPELPLPGDTITRISTQIQDGLVGEVLFSRNSSEEVFSLSRDRVILMLCHGAFASNHQLRVTKDESSGFVTKVVKELR